jgi:hypothetical protein
MRFAGIAFACLVVTLAAGCCMCAAPYDYCAPTFTGQCGEDCRPHARVNSAFSYGGVCEPGMAEMQGPVTYEDSGELPTPSAVNGPMPDAMPGTHSALRKRPVE